VELAQPVLRARQVTKENLVIREPMEASERLDLMERTD